MTWSSWEVVEDQSHAVKIRKNFDPEKRLLWGIGFQGIPHEAREHQENSLNSDFKDENGQPCFVEHSGPVLKYVVFDNKGKKDDKFLTVYYFCYTQEDKVEPDTETVPEPEKQENCHGIPALCGFCGQGEGYISKEIQGMGLLYICADCAQSPTTSTYTH